MNLQAALPTDPEALRALALSMMARVAEQDVQIASLNSAIEAARTEAARVEDALASAEDEIKRLNDILGAFKRHRFGPSSEKNPDQYNLVLEELEAALSRAHAGLEAAIPLTDKQKRRRRINRGSLPAHLERIEQLVDVDDKCCACCGGDLHVIGEDVSERLDVVPAQFRVLVTRRPRYGCRGCDEAKVIQAPAPSWIIDQGLPTNALVAQVVVSRFADHLPLYRQAQIYARQGVELDRSTLADWVGRAAWWLLPLREHLFSKLRSSVKLFADETRLPVLAPKTGKTRNGFLWAYARDDRPWGGEDPPAVVYVYATGRGGEWPMKHLEGFAGVLQVDAYGGYNRIARERDVTLALCMLHARRLFYKLADKEPVAAEVVKRFGLIYRIEAAYRGLPPAERLAGRQSAMVQPLAELRDHLISMKRRFSANGKMAEAINYTLGNWDGLTQFMQDGRVELDNNSVERSIRPIALSRKNSLFAGSDLGAENWAIIASLLETAKLNQVDPLAWLTATLDKLASGHSNKELDALMPWNFARIAA